MAAEILGDPDRDLEGAIDLDLSDAAIDGLD